MNNRYFEAEHISESGMMRYIALSNLSGQNRVFAKLVQKHLCRCEACRLKMRLLEELSEASEALGKYRRKSSFESEYREIASRLSYIQVDDINEVPVEEANEAERLEL